MIPYDHRSNYLFNSTINNIENADVVLLVGCNPRHEATMVNARLRKAVKQNNCTIGLIGEQVNLAYPYQFLSDDPSVLSEITKGSHPFSKVLKSAKNPLLILGTSCFLNANSTSILHQTNELHKKFSVQVNVLHTAASRVGGLDVGFVPATGGKDFHQILESTKTSDIKILYLLNVDIDEDFSNAFVIYQGHHGDKGAHNADIILPGAAYTEKAATYVNMEGKSQQTKQALLPPGDAKEDWKIIRALSEVLGKTLPFNTLDQLQNLLPKFNNSTAFEPFNVPDSKINSNHFETTIKNYYMHDVISRHSANMANATSEIQGDQLGII
jgi:NADH-quinone oxidoreductase subunit G